MDRGIEYPAQQPQDTDILLPQRYAMIGIAMLTQAALGNNPAATIAAGFSSTIVSFAVTFGKGSVYQQAEVDSTPYGSAGTDTDLIIKQFISAGSTVLSCPAPGTAGQSINYLVQVEPSTSDTDDTVLAFYNAADPQFPYAGPNNDGTASATLRTDAAVPTVKAGTAAATGSQTTPSPDGGCFALYVVTATNGAGAVTIEVPANSILLTYNLSTWQGALSGLATAAGLTFTAGDTTLLTRSVEALIAGATPAHGSNANGNWNTLPDGRLYQDGLSPPLSTGSNEGTTTITFPLPYTGTTAPNVTVTPNNDPNGSDVGMGFEAIPIGVSGAWTGLTVKAATLDISISFSGTIQFTWNGPG